MIKCERCVCKAVVFFVTLALSGFRTVGGVSYFVSIVACLCVNEQEFCNSLS